MHDAGYETLSYNNRVWVRRGERLLGAYSGNHLRSYVFPLYTPGGALVLQEAPPDHPHHQGLFAGLNVDGHDLWNAGSGDVPCHRQVAAPTVREMEPSITAEGVTIAHGVCWTTAAGEEVLQEQRRVTIGARAGCTAVVWRSSFGPASRPVELRQTKEAGIGVRVPPHWETIFGGKIRNAEGMVGEFGCFDRESAWLNIQGPAYGASVAGVVFAPAPGSEICPWFTRDYGLHVYNPLRHRRVSLATGTTYSWEVRLVAYDGMREIGAIDDLMRALTDI
jgi:hypothetical protein